MPRRADLQVQESDYAAGERMRVVSAEMYEGWGYRPIRGLRGTVVEPTVHGQYVVILDDGRELYFNPEELTHA